MSQVQFMLQACLIVVIAVTANVTFADGASNGGGGNIVICDGKEPVVIDYFEAAMDPRADLIPVDGLDEEQVIAAVEKNLTGLFQFHSQLLGALNEIGPIDQWIPAKLKDSGDTKEPYDLPDGCHRETAAFRQNPLTMFQNPVLIKSLSKAQRGILRLHEASYLLAYRLTGATTSVSVRNLMKALLRRVSDRVEIQAYIKEIGGNPKDIKPLWDAFFNDIEDGNHSPLFINPIYAVINGLPVFKFKLDRQNWKVGIEDRSHYYGEPNYTFDCTDSAILRANGFREENGWPEIQCPVIGANPQQIYLVVYPAGEHFLEIDTPESSSGHLLMLRAQD